jgi:hypothetical protein
VEALLDLTEVAGGLKVPIFIDEKACRNPLDLGPLTPDPAGLRVVRDDDE